MVEHPMVKRITPMRARWHIATCRGNAYITITKGTPLQHDTTHPPALTSSSSLPLPQQQSEPKKAKKLSRVERELASLAPWAWDPLVGTHAPGASMMRDFTEVAADKVVTGNTDMYDGYRAQVVDEDGVEDEVEGLAKGNGKDATSTPMAKKRNSPRDFSKSKLSDAVSSMDTKAPTKPERASQKRARPSPGDVTPSVVAPSTAAKSTPKVKELKAHGKNATPLTVDEVKKSKLPTSGKPSKSSAVQHNSKGKSKPKTASNLSTALLRKSSEVVGKNLVEALEKAAAVQGTDGGSIVDAVDELSNAAPTRTTKKSKAPKGKENVPPGVGVGGNRESVIARGPRSARDDRRSSDVTDGVSASLKTLTQLPPLLPLQEKLQRERALLAVAAAEASSAEKLRLESEKPPMTNSQQLLQAYYDLTGSRVLPVVSNWNTEQLRLQTVGRQSEINNQQAAQPVQFTNSFHQSTVPVCVTVGPFTGHISSSDFKRFSEMPQRVVPLTEIMAKACNYLGKKESEMI